MNIAAKRKYLHLLLLEAGIVQQKKELVSVYSNGRAVSSTELSEEELDAFIADMVLLTDAGLKKDACQRMRRKVLSCFHLLGWNDQNGDIDMNRVNNWCMQYSVHKKYLNAHSYLELAALVTQVKRFQEKTLGSVC
jgi:hypothetical protein